MGIPSNSALSLKIAHILLHDWNPIGVREFGAPTDEYDSYVRIIETYVRGGDSVDVIAEALMDISREQMGLEGDPAQTRRAAEKLHQLFTE
jgi:hypothetical protein